VPSRRWPFDSTFRIVSYPFRVRSDLPDVARLLPQLLDAFGDRPERVVRSYELTRETGSDPNPFVVRLGGKVAFRTATPLGVIDEVLWHVNREALGRPTGYLAVHASAAARGDRAVVLPASQDSGKSTTVAGLVRSGGYAYLTDEGALFELGTGSLHPYPKPLWLSPESVVALGDLRERILPEYRGLHRTRTYVRAQDLDSLPAPVAARVAVVVSPRFIPGARTTLDPLSRAETLMCLAQNAFNLRERGHRGLETLQAVMGSASGYRLVFGKLDEAVRTIDGLLDHVSPGTGSG
jgi:hypothetical protein